MSTQATVVALDTKPEVITFALIGEEIADGTDVHGQPKTKIAFRAASREKDLEEARTAGSLVIEQSFAYEKAGTIAGITQVVDAEEAINIFNAGLKTRFQSKVTALLTELDAEGNPVFQSVEGNYDMRDILREPAQRRGLSPVEKAQKTLAAIPGMTQTMIDSLLAQLRGNTVSVSE